MLLFSALQFTDSVVHIRHGAFRGYPLPWPGNSTPFASDLRYGSPCAAIHTQWIPAPSWHEKT